MKKWLKGLSEIRRRVSLQADKLANSFERKCTIFANTEHDLESYEFDSLHRELFWEYSNIPAEFQLPESESVHLAKYAFS